MIIINNIMVRLFVDIIIVSSFAWTDRKEGSSPRTNTQGNNSYPLYIYDLELIFIIKLYILHEYYKRIT